MSSNFRTFDSTGKVLLDAELSTFCLLKAGRLSYVEPNVVNDKFTPRYSTYVIDIPNAIAPIIAVHYEASTADVKSNYQAVPALTFLCIGKEDGTTKAYFYSNGVISPQRLSRFRIYVFDIFIHAENKVGLNLYHQDGRLSFSSKAPPFNPTLTVLNYGEQSFTQRLQQQGFERKGRHATQHYDDDRFIYALPEQMYAVAIDATSIETQVHERRFYNVSETVPQPPSYITAPIAFDGSMPSGGGNYTPSSPNESTEHRIEHEDVYYTTFHKLSCVGVQHGIIAALNTDYNYISTSGKSDEMVQGAEESFMRQRPAINRTVKYMSSSRNYTYPAGQLQWFVLDVSKLPFPFGV